MSRLGSWVKARPETVTEVAAMLGIGRVALHRYMAGSVMPRPDTARRIERVSDGAVTAADMMAAYQATRDAAV